jgi:CHAT domain-containing protein
MSLVGGDQTGLSEEAELLMAALETSGLDAEQARQIEERAIDTAQKRANSGLLLEAGTLWAELGYRSLNSPHANLATLHEALRYLAAATKCLQDQAGDEAATMTTLAFIYTAGAWARMPWDGRKLVEEKAMRAARKAVACCPRGEDGNFAEAQVLKIWGDLMAHRHLRSRVSRRDARLIREIAVEFLERRAGSQPDVAHATFALALSQLRIGDQADGLRNLRAAERLAEDLDDWYGLGRCIDQRANALVTRDGRAAYGGAARLHLRAAAAFEESHSAFACAESFRAAGALYLKLGRWGMALRAFRRSVSGWETVLEEAVLLPRANEATRSLAQTQHAIVLCLKRLGRLREAAGEADRARARRLRAMPRRFSADVARIRAVRPDLADRYAAAHRDVRLAEKEELRLRDTPSLATPERVGALMDRMRTAKLARRELQDEIRAVPGLERSFAPPTLRRIQGALPSGAVAAYVASTPYGGVAILVSRTTVFGLSLPKLTSNALSNRLGAIAECYDAWRQDQRDPYAERRLGDEIEASGKWVWDAFMGRLLRSSRGFERLILLPSDGLDFLPLHAAWSETPEGGRVYALDVLPISLAPSADLQPTPPEGGWVNERSGLAVAEPAPVSAGPLPAAHAEATAIQAAFHGARLEGVAATKEAVVGAMQEADLIHMACHGQARFGRPYASYLLMAHDEELQVSDIVDVELDRRPFVFLSACETGAHDLDMADETQSLAAALISAGAAGVISTLWVVFDLSALLVALVVYDELLCENDPDRALHHAQRWMRDTPTEDKARRIRDMAWLPGSIREDTERRLRDAGIDLTAPLNWAAHAYSGA